MQVFRGERILGYVKTSESEVIADLFERETRTLRQLRALGVESIPEALFCGRADGRFVFVQSTEKTLHSKVPDVFGESHRDWLEALYRKTRRTTPFEETALKVDLEYLREETSVLDTRLRGIFAQAITLTEAHYAAQREFGFIHGDFTPWNLYEEAGTLHPFDFEYASEGYPAFLDAVHFLLQIQILVEKRTQEEAFAALEQQKHWIPTEDRNFLILAYLLHIIAHYMRLFDGRSMSEDNGFIIWTGLIEKYKNLCVIKES
jgi:tRNA A-37 threonylcarbamoyl transferase component Bud32